MPRPAHIATVRESAFIQGAYKIHAIVINFPTHRDATQYYAKTLARLQTLLRQAGDSVSTERNSEIADSMRDAVMAGDD